MIVKKSFTANLNRKARLIVSNAKILFISLFLIIIVLARLDIKILQTFIIDITSSIVRPFALLDNIIHKKYIQQISDIKKENILLKQQLNKLRYLQIENEQIKLEANYRSYPGFNSIITRAFYRIATDTDNFFILDAGTNDGVNINSIVINEHGLVGIIIEAGKTWSRAIYMFNKLFKVAVILQNSKLEAIISGNNASIEFDILSEDRNIPNKDIIMTSGRCGYFPAGLLVGKIRNGKIIPFSKIKNVNYVVVLTKNQQR